MKFLTGPDPAQKETGPKSAQNKLGLLSTGLDSAQPETNSNWGYCTHKQ